METATQLFETLQGKRQWDHMFLNAEWGNQNTFYLEFYILHKCYIKYPSTHCAKILQKYSLKMARK